MATQRTGPYPHREVSIALGHMSGERSGRLLDTGQMWPGTESNRRHEDFQSSALPTELPGQKMLMKSYGQSPTAVLVRIFTAKEEKDLCDPLSL
jgi:hypothetical protein